MTGLTKKILDVISEGGRVNFERGFRVYIVSVYKYSPNGTKLKAKEARSFKIQNPEYWDEWIDLENDITEAINEMWSHIKAIR